MLIRSKIFFLEGKSEFQTVDVIETKHMVGCCLIDGLVMITDRDEFVYHEMIAHIPALITKNLKELLLLVVVTVVLLENY